MDFCSILNFLGGGQILRTRNIDTGQKNRYTLIRKR